MEGRWMGAGREMEGDGGSRLCYEIVYESVDPDGGHGSTTLLSTLLLHSTLLLFYSTLHVDSTPRIYGCGVTGVGIWAGD